MDTFPTTKPAAGPREVFMHLLLIITLYLSVVSFIALLWQYINLLVPDVLQLYYAAAYQGIRWASSVLLVSFPVYLWLSWQLQRDFTQTPSKRELKVRKWLLHLTLFLAALTIIGDLITLIYSFYGGELSARFLLKIVVVLAVAASVFWYYLWDIRRGSTAAHVPRRAGIASASLVGLALVAGFFIGGSPAHQRQLRFDEQRVSDLQNIQGQMIYYWQQKGQLPKELGQLTDSISGFTVPTDPDTGASYEYAVKNSLSFELCAVFTTASDAGSTGPRPVPAKEFGVTENWQHGSGKICFARTIDPQLRRLPSPN